MRRNDAKKTNPRDQGGLPRIDMNTDTVTISREFAGQILALLEHTWPRGMTTDSFRKILEQPQPANQWQPIDTAPKDGTKIDLWGFEFGAGFVGSPKPRRFIGCKYIPPSERWNRGQWWHPNYGNIEPTHWMPLPPAPNP